MMINNVEIRYHEKKSGRESIINDDDGDHRGGHCDLCHCDLMDLHGDFRGDHRGDFLGDHDGNVALDLGQRNVIAERRQRLQGALPFRRGFGLG